MNVKVRKQSSAGLHCVNSFRIPIFPGPYYPAFSPNAGKYGPEKIRVRTLFTQFSC